MIEISAPAQSFAGLIKRKIMVPEQPDHLIDRPRVHQVLADLLQRCQIVVVVATAGAGKTTAVRQATSQFGSLVSWFSIDSTEKNPGRLLAYLEESIALCVPLAQGVATRALRAGVPHAESAGLLAESLSGHELVLVIDDLERLGDSGDSWETLGSFMHRLPTEVKVVLISRMDIPDAVHREVSPITVASIGEEDLAFTVDEAAAALAINSDTTIDAASAVAATGGWVTGVLFEAWRSEEHTAAVGGEADPLKGYISSRILSELDDADREFLISTALFVEVKACRASALGLPDAAARMHSLRAKHLPAVWTPDGRTMRCHPRFREFLLELLERRHEEDRRLLRHNFGMVLEAEGHDEEATEVFLSVGSLDHARVCGARAIGRVIERLDLQLAERWLAAFGSDLIEAHELTTARLMLAWGRDDYREGVSIANSLRDAGTRDALVVASERAAALMIFCYGQCGAFDQVDHILEVATRGPEVAAVLYSLGSVHPSYRRESSPPLTGGPFDSMVLLSKYWFGLLADIEVSPEPTAGTSFATPWHIGALRTRGHTKQALALYERARVSVPNSMSLYAVAPELLLDAGRISDAFQAMEAGQRIAQVAGAHVWSLGFTAGLARLQLRERRDPEATAKLLDSLEQDPLLEQAREALIQARICRGWLELRNGDTRRAGDALREAITVIQASGYQLELPAAAILLAEAEWRAGNDGAADAAADLALDAATRQGSQHVLLQTLAEFPAVASRRIDAEPGSDTAWHGVGRALAAQGASVTTVERIPSVRLQEFGKHVLTIDGVTEHPRISMSLELLSFLGTRHHHSAGRDDILRALFDRDDRSTRSYLRQAVHQLNLLLPQALRLITDTRSITLAATVARGCQSRQFRDDLAHAQSLLGAEKLESIEHILDRNQGLYLADRTSPWVDERREHLSHERADALTLAAELALSLHRYALAIDLCNRATALDPLREVVWRVQMTAASALGDDDGVLSAFHRCEKALALIDARPSPSTNRLLRQLRR